jgi:hypothetical protein
VFLGIYHTQVAAGSAVLVTLTEVILEFLRDRTFEMAPGRNTVTGE